MQKVQQEMLLQRSAVYAEGLLSAEEVPADSPFAFVDVVEIDQRVEVDHLVVETLVVAAVAASAVVASQPCASGVAFAMDFEPSSSSAAAAAAAH